MKRLELDPEELIQKQGGEVIGEAACMSCFTIFGFGGKKNQRK